MRPVGVFNWNLYLQECLSCTSVILFPLFWHLEATSVSPQYSHRSSTLLALGNQQLLQSCTICRLVTSQDYCHSVQEFIAKL